MTKPEIDRINELAAKAKTEIGLTSSELDEQKQLRQKYIGEMRASLRSGLESVKVQNEDGTITPLSKKGDKKS